VPRSAIAVLTRFGHQVEFARDIGLAAAPDEQIAAHARQNMGALHTRDPDFAGIRRYPPKRYSGIVVLRLPDNPIAAEIVSVLEPQSTIRCQGLLALQSLNRRCWPCRYAYRSFQISLSRGSILRPFSGAHRRDDHLCR
jgi:hypothetical protein